MFIAINYLNMAKGSYDGFCESLVENVIYMSPFQQWFFIIFSILFDSLILFIIMFIFIYYIRDLSTITYYFIGLAFRYFSAFVLIALYISFSKTNFIELFTASSNFDISMIIQFALQISFSIIVTRYAQFVCKQQHYLDIKDAEKQYFNGIPKRVWLLLIVSFNPIVNFLLQLTNINIYHVTEKLSTSFTNWKNILLFINIFGSNTSENIIGVFFLVLVVFLCWVFVGSIFNYGLKVIKDKSKKYRFVLIFIIFILLPLLILVIPLIRNKTWFY